MNPEPIETAEPSLPLVVREPEAPRMDAAQARIEAVANVLHKAYERASTLQLTPDEVAALTADFADADFRTGAAGKENLIYIEHASLRERLNKVIGVGQWSLVVRNRWTESFQTAKHEEAQRVYVEAVLLIRGCFAGEAVGDMVYYPSNQAQNFGDAFEGAKSAALRRCAKELGLGLQAWHKDFCEGWFARKAGHRTPATPRASQPPKTPPAAPKAPAPLETPAERRKRFLDLFVRYGDAANEVFSRHDLILPGVETIDDIHDSKIDMMNKAHVFALLEEVKMAYGEGEPSDPEPAQEEFKVNPPDDEPWRDLQTPFNLKETPAGTSLGLLEKGQLWWWVMVWKPERWNDKKTGQLHNPSERSVEFFNALKPHRAQIIARYKFTPPKE